MPAYLVVAVTYRNKGWTDAYRRDVPALVAAYGGRYLAKSLDPERLEGEGDKPDTLAILEFPTAEAARTMLASPEYRPYAEARTQGAQTTIFLL
ncbi:MAG: DUF1330 domain-containing protein [Allosphingosinicella sp.]|uniref:DUF1330 domain-containing protein n=1 Tax=Allosphingosinicella sp. TaxID=2823234 RepID=UPI00392A427E